LKRLTSSAPLTSRMRAAAWALEVRIGSCQPCHERALTPKPSSTIASSPAVTCSPEDTTASYSRASCQAGASRHQPTSRAVAPAMAETTTATSWPASTSRLTCRATLWMRSISATEVPPNFITRRAMVGLRLLRRSRGVLRFTASPRAKRRVYIPGEGAWPQPRLRRRIDGEQDQARRRLDRRRGGGGAVFRPRRRVVGSARRDGDATQVQPGAARFHQAGSMPAIRRRGAAPRRTRGPARTRHRLRRRHSERAVGAPWRGGGWRRSLAGQYRGGEAARGRGGRCRGLPRADGRSAFGARRTPRHRGPDGSGRAWWRTWTL